MGKPAFHPALNLCSSFDPTEHGIQLGVIRKGQALQFNWLFEKGAFVLHPDETFSVNFSKV